MVECAHYDWIGYDCAPTIPGLPEPEPGFEPDVADPQPGARGDEWLVAAGDFPGTALRGVLWGAKIESYSRAARNAGEPRIEVTAPTTAANLRLLGVESTEVDQFGRPLYRPDPISWELLAGVNGDVTDRYVVRDRVQIQGGSMKITGQGLTVLPRDRVVGAPTRLNLLNNAGSFERGDLRGWRLVGDADGAVEAGGVDGAYCAWVTGTPNGLNYLEARITYPQPARPWGRQKIAGTAYVKLPAAGLDITDYTLVTVAIFSGGVQVYPFTGAGDQYAALVTDDMARGTWTTDPVEALGVLPHPPFTAEVWIRLHPTDETAKTYFDGCEIIRRENTSTVSAVDLTHGVGRLFEHFQTGRMKSSWNLNKEYGTPTGVEEVSTFWHEDGQSGPEAIESICGRDDGPDVWPLAPGRTIKIGARRGAVRNDLLIRWWDVLAQVGWEIDPGAQITTIRATSSAGSLWGGADEGASDTTQTGGQVIDVVMPGPSGLTPSKLKAWVRAQVATHKLLPATTRLVLRWELGRRIAVGDSIRVGLIAGAAVHDDWMRVTDWVCDPARRLVMVGFGTDPDLGEGG